MANPYQLCQIPTSDKHVPQVAWQGGRYSMPLSLTVKGTRFMPLSLQRAGRAWQSGKFRDGQQRRAHRSMSSSLMTPGRRGAMGPVRSASSTNLQSAASDSSSGRPGAWKNRMYQDLRGGAAHCAHAAVAWAGSASEGQRTRYARRAPLH